MKTNFNSLGEIVTEIRKYKKFSQSALADLLGITQAYLSQIENDQKFPSNALLKKISNIFQIPVSVLMYLTIQENEVPEEKRLAWRMLQPTINALIASVFLSDKLL